MGYDMSMGCYEVQGSSHRLQRDLKQDKDQLKLAQHNTQMCYCFVVCCVYCFGDLQQRFGLKHFKNCLITFVWVRGMKCMKSNEMRKKKEKESFACLEANLSKSLALQAARPLASHLSKDLHSFTWDYLINKAHFLLLVAQDVTYLKGRIITKWHTKPTLLALHKIDFQR